MKIYIPTYRRCTEKQQATVSRLPKELHSKVAFVVDEQDFRPMVELADRIAPDAEVLLSDAKTIAAKRAWILQRSFEVGDSCQVQLDDDLKFDVRVYNPPGSERRFYDRKATNEEVGKFLGELEEKLMTEYIHAGFSARHMNNTRPDGWHEIARQMYVLGYRPAEVVGLCELGRIEHREDFDLTLQLLRKGYPNAVTSDIMAGQAFNSPGGCSEQRTMEASNADAEKLAELHPGFVRVVRKNYKQSIDRLEVVVQWKKAYNASRT